MLNRDELLNAYAIPDRDQSRIRVNFISSADGAVTRSGRAGGLGGPADHLLMQVLRTMADVVLVGAGTVRAEGYAGLGLQPADQDWRQEHLLTATPPLAIVSNLLDLEPGSPVFAGANGRPLLVTFANAPADRRELLAQVAEVLTCGEQAVDLPMLVSQFATRGLFQILCEGGPHLFGSLLAADLVDEVCLTVAPRFLAGNAGRIAVWDQELDRSFGLASMLSDDDGFVFLRYLRVRGQ